MNFIPCPPTLLAVDPSKTCCGYALFRKGFYDSSGFKKVSQAKGAPPWEYQYVEYLMQNWLRRSNDVLIEDVTGFTMGQKRRSPLPWAKTVGLIGGTAIAHKRRVHWHNTSWIQKMGLPSAQRPETKKIRLLAAEKITRKPVENVDEATAVLFGHWWITNKTDWTGR